MSHKIKGMLPLWSPDQLAAFRVQCHHPGCEVRETDEE